MKMQLVGAATVGKVCGVSRQRINNLVADGVLPRADRGRFDLPSVVQAFFRYKYDKARAGDAEVVNLTSERTRLAKLKADAAEREAKVESGALVPVADVESAWLTIVGTVRTRMLVVPKKIAPRLVTLKTAVDAEALLQKEIYAALSALAETPTVKH